MLKLEMCRNRKPKRKSHIETKGSFQESSDSPPSAPPHPELGRTKKSSQIKQEEEVHRGSGS